MQTWPHGLHDSTPTAKCSASDPPMDAALRRRAGMIGDSVALSLLAAHLTISSLVIVENRTRTMASKGRGREGYPF